MDVETRRHIRSIYKNFNPTLADGFRRSPYDLGMEWEFTPIEDNVWGDIRYLGLPLYPQFPIGPYFVDFGDPIRKIGIEVDSKEWHKDWRKDAKRQRELEKLGWHIIRIPSHLTYKQREDFEEENGSIAVDKYLTGCAEGILFKVYWDVGYFHPNVKF